MQRIWEATVSAWAVLPTWDRQRCPWTVFPARRPPPWQRTANLRLPQRFLERLPPERPVDFARECLQLRPVDECFPALAMRFHAWCRRQTLGHPMISCPRFASQRSVRHSPTSRRSGHGRLPAAVTSRPARASTWPASARRPVAITSAPRASRQADGGAAPSNRLDSWPPFSCRWSLRFGRM